MSRVYCYLVEYILYNKFNIQIYSTCATAPTKRAFSWTEPWSCRTNTCIQAENDVSTMLQCWPNIDLVLVRVDDLITSTSLLFTRNRAYAHVPVQQTREINPMLVQCWASIVDGGPTLYQHWLDASCLLGSYILCIHSLYNTPSQWILLYLALCTIIAISRQKKAWNRDYALL